MSLYQIFQTDEQHEKEGIVLDYGQNGRIRIARAGGGNSRFAKLLGDRLKPYRRQIDNGAMDDKVAEKIMAEVYADTIILGWEEISGPTGQPMEYNRDNCVKLLTDLPELFRDIQEQAAKVSNFRREELADDVKN